MLTAKDIAKLKTIFVTSDEFATANEKILTVMDAVMFELKAIREELIVLVHQVARLSDRVDNIEAELKGMRADHDAFIFLHDQHRDRLDNHEGRIEVIESKPSFT